MVPRPSTSSRRRQRERRATRRRFLDAARRMFVRNGYEATTMRAIAREVDYSPTALYHHFRSKAALLVELGAIDFGALARTFLRIDRRADPLTRMGRIAEAYVGFALTHPMQYRLMFMTPRPAKLELPEPGDPGEDAYGILRQTCADLIASGRLRPDVTDPDGLAQILWGSLHGIVSLQLVMRNDDWITWRDARALARSAGSALLRGLLRTPEETPGLFFE